MEQSLRNQFLLSMPHMEDPWFHHSLSLLCEHSEQGAMGIIVNKPLELSLKDIFAELELACADANDPVLNTPVYFGGPVQPEQGFILHSNDGRHWKSTLTLADELCLTSSRDILEAIAKGQGPKQFLVALGYAGWSADQLEGEIAANAWLTHPANNEILFQQPADQKLPAAAAAMGIDLNLLTSQSGHA